MLNHQKEVTEDFQNTLIKELELIIQYWIEETEKHNMFLRQVNRRYAQRLRSCDPADNNKLLNIQ